MELNDVSYLLGRGLYTTGSDRGAVQLKKTSRTANKDTSDSTSLLRLLGRICVASRSTPDASTLTSSGSLVYLTDAIAATYEQSSPFPESLCVRADATNLCRSSDQFSVRFLSCAILVGTSSLAIAAAAAAALICMRPMQPKQKEPHDEAPCVEVFHIMQHCICMFLHTDQVWNCHKGPSAASSSHV